MDAVGTTSSVSRDSEPSSDDLCSCQFIESHTPTPSTFSAHVRRILPHVQGRVHRKIRLSLPVVIPLSENCRLFKRGVPERLSEDFSKSLSKIGWEAGIRPPIRRSRVFYRLLIPKEINNLARQIAAESGKIRNAAARKNVPKAQCHDDPTPNFGIPPRKGEVLSDHIVITRQRSLCNAL